MTTSLDALLDELRALDARGGVVAFDADGTLWEGDIGYDVLYSLFDEEGVRDEALAALRAEAREAGLPAEGSATALARALTQAYFDGRYDETRAFAMMSWVFAGRSPDEARAYAARVLEAKGLAARVRSCVRPLLDWAASAGAEAIVVSASPRFAIDVALAQAGLSFGAAFGMDVAVAGGVLAPRLAAAPTSGAGKLATLRRERPGRPLVAAFGDGGWDRPMVEAARVPVAMGAGSALAKAGIPGLRVLEV